MHVVADPPRSFVEDSVIGAPSKAGGDESPEGSQEDKCTMVTTATIAENGTQISKISLDVATKKAVRPFKKRSRYIYPFLRDNKCPHKTGGFHSYNGLIRHVDAKHRGMLCPSSTQLEDGTLKIPCPRECGQMFPSYDRANYHAKNPTLCKATPRKNVLCPWSSIIGCETICKDPKALANHHRAHVQDARSPFQCSKGCGEFHADLYILAAHETKCEGEGAMIRISLYQFELSVATSATSPRVIIVGRSSGGSPLGWKMGKETFEEGLPLWGHAIRREYVRFIGDESSAILHVCNNVATRHLPAPEHNDSPKEKDQKRRNSLSQAWKFTAAITRSITMANEADIVPTLLSVGLDGWACDVRMILPYLLHRELQFKLVLRVPELYYGLSAKYFSKTGDSKARELYWATYDSDVLRRTLEKEPGLDEATDNLVLSWQRIQDLKDLRANENALYSGRNRVTLEDDSE